MKSTDIVKIFVLSLFVLFCLVAALPVAAKQEGMLQGSHGDRSVMSKGCRACHRGMTMSISGEEDVCLSCHGSSAARNSMVEAGFLKDVGGLNLFNISNELNKTYSHPVLSIKNVHQNVQNFYKNYAKKCVIIKM